MPFYKTCLLALALPVAFAAHAQQPLNFYYGNLHAHTAYSDGNKDSLSSGATTPRQAFEFARASQHFDFLGISEHNHVSAGMRGYRWALGRQQADSANVNGQFVALFGMEWGVISGGGHVLVYGSNELLGWDPGNYDVYVARNDYAGLWRAINRRPGAFASLAHPDNNDYNNLVNTAFNPVADSAIVGTPLRSGPAFSTSISYADQSSSSYESYFRNALAKGYHVAPSYDHDNHNTTFGRTTEGRIVVLAPALTRDNLMQALRDRHFYASDDWNAQASLTLNQQWPMGTIAQDMPAPTITVTLADGDSEPLRSLVLMSGVPGSGAAPTQVAAATAGSTAITFTDNNLALGATAYYYAVAIQTDNDKVLTAPVWYTRGTPLPTGVAAEITPALALTVWPNPVQTATGEAVTVSFANARPGEAVSITVFDALGRAVLTPVAGLQDARLDVVALAPGIYTVRVVAGAATAVSRLVVQ